MVWSSGLTPAAIIRTSTLPAANVGLGTSTSFRPPYPVNDSARIALITPPLDPCPRYEPVERGRDQTKCSPPASRDHEIVMRDLSGRDNAVVQGLQQAQPLFLRTS